MRRFLVTACCVIVALQVLIGVPLVVCIAFLSLVEMPTVSLQPTPVHYASAPVDLPAPLPPDYYPKAPVSNLQPIVESRAQYGSPLAESSLAAPSPAEELRQFVTALEQLATGNEAPPNQLAPPSDQLPAPAATIHPASDCQATSSDSAALLASLGASVEHLYALCQRLEADTEYSRADEIRQLARRIREEMDAVRRHESPPAPVTWEEPTLPPPTVTEASFNPEPPPAPAPAIPPPPVPTEPAPAPSLPYPLQ